MSLLSPELYSGPMNETAVISTNYCFILFIAFIQRAQKPGKSLCSKLLSATTLVILRFGPYLDTKKFSLYNTELFIRFLSMRLFSYIYQISSQVISLFPNSIFSYISIRATWHHFTHRFTKVSPLELHSFAGSLMHYLNILWFDLPFLPDVSVRMCGGKHENWFFFSEVYTMELKNGHKLSLRLLI